MPDPMSSPTPSSTSTRRSLPVPEGLAGERVDVGLARLLGLSRTAAAELAASGAVLIDGREAAKSDRLVGQAWLEVDLPDRPATSRTAQTSAALVTGRQGLRELGLRVVHDDDDLVVVDKPVGVAAHPSPGWSGPTVVGALAAAGYRIATSGAAERQGVVHRLDVGTSGLMVVAKSESAYSALKDAFRRRTVDKVYHALVQGHPDPLIGTVDAPIGRHPVHDHRWAVVAGGKPSLTHYQVIEAFPAASLVEVHLETGRTHQIRVHMAALRHPCVGDLTYGADPVLAARLGLSRQWLHAVRLGFTHPGTGEPVEFTSAYPPDLAEALERL
jgi:23S rRNA pseudouridine1911/1915/1917 synthase